jgi:hypothetical protein
VPTQVNIPEVGTVNFPDSMDHAAISAAAGKLHAQALEKKAMNPASVYPAAPGPKSVQPTAIGQELEKWGNRFAQAAPAAGGMLGAAAGGLAAGPAGAIRGATIGGAVGEAGKELALSGGKSVKPWSVLESGAAQGGMEIGGQMAAGAAARIAPKLMKSADEAMNKILGLKVSQLGKSAPKTEKSVLAVGRAVNDAVGGARSASVLRDKVGSAIGQLTDITEDIVQNTPQGRLINFRSSLLRSAGKTIDEAKARNLSAQADAVRGMVKKLAADNKTNMTPKELLDLRRTLKREVDPTTGQALWPAGTKNFRNELYHEINRQIVRALPPKQAAQFAANNAKVSKLIIAQAAIESKLAKAATGLGKRELVGAGIGASEEGYRTHSLEGAARGAAIGAVLGKASSSTAIRSAAIAGRRALASPAVARVLERTPQAVRVAKTIDELSGKQ